MSTNLARALAAWSEGYMRQFKEHMTEFGQDRGLTPGQVRLMMGMHRRGTLSAGDMSAAWDITPSAITQIMDKLIERELVERFEDPQDRRVKLHRLTDAGRAAAMQYHRIWDVLAERIAAVLDDDAVENATNLLKQMTEAISETTA